MEFRDKIKLLRSSVGLSQEALSKELGVSFATVNRWETGKNLPNYNTLRELENFSREKNIKIDW